MHMLSTGEVRSPSRTNFFGDEGQGGKTIIKA